MQYWVQHAACGESVPSLHATQQIWPGAVKRFAKPGEHLYTWVGRPRLNSLKLPRGYPRLIAKFFLRQSQRHENLSGLATPDHFEIQAPQTTRHTNCLRVVILQPVFEQLPRTVDPHLHRFDIAPSGGSDFRIAHVLIGKEQHGFTQAGRQRS
jgi:hypothetical protein